MIYTWLQSNGNQLYVNPELVVLAAPAAQLVNKTQLMLSNGISVEVDGSVSEVVAKLEGRNVLCGN